MKNSLKKYTMTTIILLLLFIPSIALAENSLFLNGANGEYWGLSKQEVLAKASGKMVEEKKEKSMTITKYILKMNNIPIETYYIFKDDVCVSTRIILKSDNIEHTSAIKIKVDELVKKLYEILGKPTHEDSLSSYMVIWEKEITSALIIFTTEDPLTSKAMLEVKISYESKKLANNFEVIEFSVKNQL